MKIRCCNCFEQYEEEFELCPYCGHIPGNPAKELYHLYPGMILNERYIVGQALGFGGFGITYKVWDKHLDVIMAVKEYYPVNVVNRVPGTKEVMVFKRERKNEYDHGLKWFLNEARNMAKFKSHKNIINVFEYFEENNTAYIVMEYLDGMTLGDFLKTNRIGVETAVSVISAVCDALKDVHAEGIVHRDVSPDNIFICANNIIKLIDFGAARFSSAEDKPLTIILKPGFAPPEQYERINTQGPWTDIYALGATLYLMVTGVKPEESTNRKIADNLVPPIKLNENIPEYISNTIMKSMAIDKYLRFNSCVEFEKALNQEKKVLPVTKERNRRRIKRFITVLSAVLVIVICTSVFLMNWNRQKKEETLPDAEISFWYYLSGDIMADTAKNDAFKAIITEFNESFPNVKIEIKTYPHESYKDELQNAISNNDTPTLFESTGIDGEILKNTVDLSDVVKTIDIEQCYFLDKYFDYFPRKNQLPIGFTVPAVYLNTTLIKFEDDFITDISVLLNSTQDKRQSVFVNETDLPAFIYTYGDKIQTETKNAKDLFISGQTDIYYSSTADYFDVRGALPARYKIINSSGLQILGKFDNLWSIRKCESNERAAAERLLLFMLSENAQDFLYIRNRNGALPINKDVLNIFCGVYNDFDNFFTETENYNFLVK